MHFGQSKSHQTTALADRAAGSRWAPSVELCNVSARHDTHLVFNDLNLSLTAGRWHVILGRSGIGKSTLLHLIAGLDTPDGGTICSSEQGQLAPHVAYLFQDDALLPWLSARDNVLLGARLRGSLSTDDPERAELLLERVGLAEWIKARPGSLSGGMRQRVALARTLFEDRPLVLMDEPFSRLDAITRAQLHRLAIELLDQHTVVMVTHDPMEALQLADEITVLHGNLSTAASRFTPPGEAPRRMDASELGEAYAELWSLLETPAENFQI